VTAALVGIDVEPPRSPPLDADSSPGRQAAADAYGEVG
jgi:hypothetical protein